MSSKRRPKNAKGRETTAGNVKRFGAAAPFCHTPTVNTVEKSALRGLYVLTDPGARGGHEALARAALQGGARVLQLRDKTLTTVQLLPVAHRLRQLTRQAGALFILNDRCDVALACEADGVHVGPDDLPPRDARRILGADKIIGVSCGDEDEAREAQTAGANYIGAGAIFGTQTKLDAGEAIGLDALRRIVAATTLPVAAIGGVGLSNIRATVEAGAAMVCVISSITSAGDEAAMTQATRELIAAARFAESG